MSRMHFRHGPYALLPEQGAPRTKIRSGFDVAGGELWFCIVGVIFELSGWLGAWRYTWTSGLRFCR